MARWVLVSVSFLAAMGCGQTSTQTSPMPAAIDLSASALAFDVLGAAAQVSATVLDDRGAPIAPAPSVGWASSDELVATVSDGLVTAEGIGTAIVSATVGSISAEVLVTVSTVQDTIDLDATMYGVSGSTIVGHEVALLGGTYRSTLIRGTYVAWSFAFGNAGTWRTHHAYFLADSTTVVGGATLNENGADQAFDATTPLSIEFDVPAAQAAQVYFPDDVLTDNIGGVSLVLQHIRR